MCAVWGGVQPQTRAHLSDAFGFAIDSGSIARAPGKSARVCGLGGVGSRGGRGAFRSSRVLGSRVRVSVLSGCVCCKCARIRRLRADSLSIRGLLRALLARARAFAGSAAGIAGRKGRIREFTGAGFGCARLCLLQTRAHSSVAFGFAIDSGSISRAPGKCARVCGIAEPRPQLRGNSGTQHCPAPAASSPRRISF